VFNYKGGPTYRCYNPAYNSKKTRNPAPSDVGIIGVLPGITGAYMAGEVIKVIIESGRILSGKVLLFNIMENTFYLISVRNIPENHNIREIGGILNT
jgi:adenylyltransferase/sulfurtransferase